MIKQIDIDGSNILSKTVSTIRSTQLQNTTEKLSLAACISVAQFNTEYLITSAE
ncbi:hypothetical protein HWV01_01995 [Moritella sp. 5]|uniref:hypothetical protein n=1 Tax=Moritella sp. 5 TaxID=2746231 RepID=UPI001BAB10BF|nr:hypothetical protein [Moritella sp. 5]QUM79181.1 hypothetical protein HWV01_01995 [Moritella sp. 5]